jgi:hypothetical protein
MLRLEPIHTLLGEHFDKNQVHHWKREESQSQHTDEKNPTPITMEQGKVWGECS